MVFVMVVVGGLTRLTESGLSITEWNPVSGAFPPLNAHDWQELFQKYKLSPQYKKINYGINLSQFKNIFWLEFIHRLLGRLVGLIFLLPLLYFSIRKKIKREMV